MEINPSNAQNSLATREDLASILPYLPLILRSSALFWPAAVVEALKALSAGPLYSKVNSGEILAIAISDLRNSLSLPPSSLHPSALDGYSLFFDELMTEDASQKWFEDVIPRMADMLLKLPVLLETHYQNAVSFDGMETGLRLLESQQQGVVFLSQELIAGLLVCAFFCLFPTTNRVHNSIARTRPEGRRTPVDRTRHGCGCGIRTGSLKFQADTAAATTGDDECKTKDGKTGRGRGRRRRQKGSGAWEEVVENYLFTLMNNGFGLQMAIGLRLAIGPNS